MLSSQDNTKPKPLLFIVFIFTKAPQPLPHFTANHNSKYTPDILTLLLHIRNPPISHTHKEECLTNTHLATDTHVMLSSSRFSWFRRSSTSAYINQKHCPLSHHSSSNVPLQEHYLTFKSSFIRPSRLALTCWTNTSIDSAVRASLRVRCFIGRLI